MEETQDQGQENSQESTGPETVQKIDDSQDSTEQSETTKDETEETSTQTYRLIDKDLTADELYEYAKTQQGHVTQLEADKKRWEESAQKEAKEMISENELLSQVDPNVREAITQIMLPVLDERDQRKEAEAQKIAQNEAFSVKIEKAKETFPGGDGMPKFDEVKVMAAMQEPDNETFDPETKWMLMNIKSYIDRENKKALKGKASGVKTESTGGSAPAKPQGKTPKTWEEANKSAISRIS